MGLQLTRDPLQAQTSLPPRQQLNRTCQIMSAQVQSSQTRQVQLYLYRQQPAELVLVILVSRHKT